MSRCILARARSALPLRIALTGLLSLASLPLTDLDAQVAPSSRRARVNGRVVDVGTNQPLEGVNVIIVGTPIAATTTADGRFVIASAPAGVYSIEAKRLGYGAQRMDNVRLVADSVRTLEFKLNSNPLRLDAVTTSATIDPTSGRNSTVSVDKLSAEDMPVPTVGGVASQIQGKVAGVTLTRNSGQPGSDVSIVLRSPIAGMQQSGVPPSPLFVVDGVFLNQTQQLTTQDIEALDVESIEVLKGAAAAALYGSRAAAGVISITTKRGKNLALGTTQFSFRSEYGKDYFTNAPEKNQHHQFRTNDKGEWVNASGVVVPRNQRVLTQFGIQDQPYLVPTYNHAKEFYQPSLTNTQTIGVQGNAAASNYSLSYSRTAQPGVIQYNDGYSRQTLRLNVDTRINEKLNINASASHIRGLDDGNPVSFANLYRIDADINLKSIDPFPKVGFPYNIIPDSATQYTNPLYSSYISDNVTKRARTQLNLNGAYRPFDWLSLTGDASYDRGDLQQTVYTPRGTPTNGGLTLGTSTGSLRIDDDITDGMQVSGGASFMKAFGDMTVKFTERGEVQREINPFVRSTGTDFSSEGLKSMSAARTKTVTQTYTDRRALALLSNLGMSYGDKYILNGLVRREGNSLFGRAKRWNTYFQASGAWNVNEESWFGLESLTQFKLRYAIGTAGNRPSFDWQYEAMSSDNVGGLVRDTRGNQLLEPTTSREQEAGLDVTYKNRVQGTFNVVSVKNTDVFNSIPAPATSGYNNVLANVGTITGNTYEATIQGQVLSNPKGLNWTVLTTAARSRNYLSVFGRTCFFDDGTGPLYKCEGSRIGEVWANRFVRDKANLRTVHANSGSQFDINDDGYVVAVGTGNTWRDGIAKSLWGTSVTVDGIAYPWGRPILELDPATNTALVARAGDFNPDFTYGLGNTFTYKNFRVYVLVSGQVGGDVYNNFKSATYASGDHKDVDQFGKSDETKKPASYYNALAQNDGLWLANFVEDASYLNVQELLIGYSIDSKRFPSLSRLGVSRVQLDLVGRNLATLTGYTGLNVMTGSGFNRLDNATYPFTRTFSAALSVTF